MNKKILINEFNKIRDIGWIKTKQKGYSGVGITFEKLLKIDENKFSFPDYYGIEIKTKRNIENNIFFTLFNTNPTNKGYIELQKIVDKFGCPDRVIKEANVLNHTTCASSKTNLGYKYKTQLFINRDTHVVYLLFFDRNNILLDSSIYWTFDDLKERLVNKCNYLALITADRKFLRNIEFFKYTDLSLYKLRCFNNFIIGLENGNISISLKIGIFRNGKYKGIMHNHGISFQISENDIEKVFKKIY